MKSETSILIKLLTWAALAGNILFMLWISYNGISEHFKGTIYEKLSYIGLMGLLVINSILVLRKRNTWKDHCHQTSCN
jgi:hypothetical protein